MIRAERELLPFSERDCKACKRRSVVGWGRSPRAGLRAALSPTPKPILGYFALTPCLVEAAGWPEVPKGLPRNPVGAILLGRMGVDESMQGHGLGARLLALARAITHESLTATGGIGMVVDAAKEKLIPFCQNHGFRRVSESSLRLFLPTRSLVEVPSH